MKNNIILILVVTVISIAVIIISIAVSAGKHNDGGSSDESRTSSETVSSSESTGTVSGTEPIITTEPEPVTSKPAETEQSNEPERIHDSQTAENIVALARSLTGTDFADGGASPAEGFDNSGFIYYVLRENGYITCPRGVSAQAEMGAELSSSELRPGDLVFFSEGGSYAEFGGIYAGDGKMIACLMPGTKVKEVDITTNYYTTHFYRGVGIN